MYLFPGVFSKIIKTPGTNWVPGVVLPPLFYTNFWSFVCGKGFFRTFSNLNVHFRFNDDHNNGGTNDNNSGTNDNNGRPTDNNGGTNDNNGGTNDNNVGTNDNNGGTNDNNGGTNDNNSGTDNYNRYVYLPGKIFGPTHTWTILGKIVKKLLLW